MRQRGTADARRWHAIVAPAALLLFALLVLAALVLIVVHLISSAGSLPQVVDLAKTFVWPIFLLFVLAFFYDPIFGFLENLNEVSVNIAGNETILKARETQARVGGLVAAAAATATGPKESQAFRASNRGLASPLVEPAPQTVARSPVKIVQSISNVGQIVNELTLPELARGTILWVDDRPSNNAYLIAAFRELGMRVDTALSTDEAMRYVEGGAVYDVIITDMGRPPDAQAGYTLLRELRARNVQLPVIVYAGSNLQEHREAAIEAGAIESTDSPERVFDLVTSVVKNRNNPAAAALSKA